MTKVMPIAITDTIAVMRNTALAVESEAKWGAKATKYKVMRAKMP